MKTKLMINTMLLVLFVAVDSAFANTGYGVFSLAPMLFIPFVVALFLARGGVNLIRDRIKRYRKILIAAIAGYIGVTLLVFVISAWFRFDRGRDLVYYLAFAFFPLFGFLIGAFMVYLGVRALSPKRPTYLAPAKPRRLIISGIALIVCMGLLLFWTYYIFTTGEKTSRYLLEKNVIRTVLTSVHDLEIEYFAENKTFSKDPAAIGLEPPIGTLRYYRYEIVSADENGFLARAWGNIDGDPNLDIWEETNRSREPYQVFNDKHDEGIQIDPRDPKPYSPQD